MGRKHKADIGFRKIPTLSNLYLGGQYTPSKALGFIPKPLVIYPHLSNLLPSIPFNYI